MALYAVFDVQMTTLFFLQRLSLFSFIETFEPKQQVYSPLLAAEALMIYSFDRVQVRQKE